MKSKYLPEILEGELFRHPDCFSDRFYTRWEREIATPALEQKGFTNIKWRMGEQDSCGPLSRICSAIDKDGNKVEFWYG
jgi:hypothetical protein